MSHTFHNLENYLFERFEAPKAAKCLEQIDTSDLEPIEIQHLQFETWKKVEATRPKTAESWGCSEGFGEWLYENMPELHFGKEGLSGKKKELAVSALIELADKHEISDFDRASKLASFASFLNRHPVVFSY